MADHIRKQIRDAIITTVTGLTTTGSRVHKSKVYPVQTFPALVVYMASEGVENSEAQTIGISRYLDREVLLRVEAYCNNEDDAELVSQEVEVAMAADTTIGGLAKDCTLASTEFQYTEGDAILVVATLSYRVQYQTTLTAPDVAL